MTHVIPALYLECAEPNTDSIVSNSNYLLPITDVDVYIKGIANRNFKNICLDNYVYTSISSNDSVIVDH